MNSLRKVTVAAGHIALLMLLLVLGLAGASPDERIVSSGESEGGFHCVPGGELGALQKPEPRTRGSGIPAAVAEFAGDALRQPAPLLRFRRSIPREHSSVAAGIAAVGAERAPPA